VTPKEYKQQMDAWMKGQRSYILIDHAIDREFEWVRLARHNLQSMSRTGGQTRDRSLWVGIRARALSRVDYLKSERDGVMDSLTARYMSNEPAGLLQHDVLKMCYKERLEDQRLRQS